LIDAKYTCTIGVGVGLCVGDEDTGLEVVGTDDGDVETGAAVGVDEGLAEGAEVVEVGLEVGVDVGAVEVEVGVDVGSCVGLNVEDVGELDVGLNVVVVGEFEVGVLVVTVGLRLIVGVLVI
jgi:hypothetical protein